MRTYHLLILIGKSRREYYPSGLAGMWINKYKYKYKGNGLSKSKIVSNLIPCAS